MNKENDGHQYSAIIADNNREYLQLLNEFLLETGAFYDVDYAFDGREALTLVEEKKPNLLVLDLIMPILDGFAVLEELYQSGYSAPTKVVMTSAVGLDFIMKKAESYHIDYIFLKPFEKKVFKRRIIDLMTHNTDRSGFWAKPKQDASEIVTKHIKTVGITANIKGYHYLRDAILLVHKNFDLMSRLTTGLYACVAQKYNSTPQCVERAMRHAIETAWNRGNIGILEEFFGYTILETRGKPTNGEFIAMLADKLNTELKHVD